MGAVHEIEEAYEKAESDELPEGAVCSREVAEAEFQRMLDSFDLVFDLDDPEFDDEDRRQFGDHRKRILRAIMRGTVKIGEEGEPTFTPVKGNTEAIVFKEPKGKSFANARDKKGGANAYALLANITGAPSTRFEHMYQRDLKVCLALLSLFLA